MNKTKKKDLVCYICKTTQGVKPVKLKTLEIVDACDDCEEQLFFENFLLDNEE